MTGRAFGDFPADVRQRAMQFLGAPGTGPFGEASNYGSEGSENSENSERSEFTETSENSENTERSEYKEYERGWGLDRLPGGPGAGLTWTPR